MCGILAILLTNPTISASLELFEGLQILQHRGQSQQFHGGQDWKFLDNFVEDFSVTTNALGTPKEALKASKDS
ncbi:10020_t:CDS:2, partial [Entrophospora sp. SA101]